MPFRPKGMWRRTFNRYFEEYQSLDELCGREIEKLETRMALGPICAHDDRRDGGGGESARSKQ